MTHGSWRRLRAQRKGGFPMKRSMAWFVGTALVAAVGCADDADLYLGGPPGPIATLAVSGQNLTVRVGDSVAVGARGHDAVGNATADVPTFASCDGSVVAVGGAATDPVFTTAAWIRGAGLGQSCVLATAAGITDSIRVTTGPVLLRVTGPDTIGSGSVGAFVAEPMTLDSTALAGTTSYRWLSANTSRAAVHPETGEASGKGPGTVAVQVFAPGGANAFKNVVIIPTPFEGTLSAASGAPGSLVSVTQAAGGLPFDADQLATLGTTAAFVDRILPGEFMFAVPASGSTAAATLTLANIGFAQLAQTTSFTATLAAADAYQPGNITNDCSDPSAAPDFAAVRSPLGSVYFTHNGTAQGTRGCQNSNAITGYDHYFIYTTGGSSQRVDVLSNWRLAGDNDIIICATDYSSCPGVGFSPGTLAELDAVNVPLAANTSYFIIYSPWTGNTGTNNIRITVNRR